MTVLTREQIQALDAHKLKALALRGVYAITSPNGNYPPGKEDLPEYKKFSHLAGNLLSISAAGRKYNIPQQTISRWVQRGIIPIQETQGNKKLISEQDIAYCALIRSRNPGAGKWLFDNNGMPYV